MARQYQQNPFLKFKKKKGFIELRDLRIIYISPKSSFKKLFIRLSFIPFIVDGPNKTYSVG